ncbi:prolyl oligopeptidase family serine peptidase [uncultured Dokdonia sp.]|uniref:prolyl oligopeptidase family serine peptidase n=1 Tax=uncultured Dokdonia sp. TaxID=575653 RepID=UPI00262C064F|nr:prolyl oligopeptidase family serine peptidase [uncultured Dokdonia sp.]
MFKVIKVIKAIVLLNLIISCANDVPTYKHPIAPSEKAIDIFFNDTIVDVYRNLENLENPEVLDWMQTQKTLADSILNNISGKQELKTLQEQYDQNVPYTVISIKNLVNKKCYYLKKKTEEKYFNLYYRKTVDSEELLLFDIEKYNKENNSNYTITYYQPDWIGDKIAIAIAKEGEEIGNIIILNSITKKILKETIQKTAPSLSGGIRWMPDNKKFMYMEHKYTDPKNENYYLDLKTKLYTIETNESIDVFSKESKPSIGIKREDFPRILYFKNYDKYILGEISGSSSFKDTYVTPIKDIDNPSWSLLYSKEDMVSSARINGDYVYFRSSLNSPNKKICRTLISDPDFENPEILIPEDKHSVITSLKLVDKGFAYVTQKNGVESKLFLYLNGEVSRIKLPKKAGDINIGTLGTIDSTIWITYSGWTTPSETLEYDIKTGVFKEDKINVKQKFTDFDNAVVEEIEVVDKEGVRIPMSLIYSKELNKDGSNPTIMLSYGAYGVSVNPFFFPSLLMWINQGGVLAIAHVRGGGEKGDSWHKAGFKITKSNSWKDAITCTEYLIKEGYTSPNKLISWGSSAGGIVGAKAMVERPDLYAAAIFDSPAINMLRCENQPNGLNSIKEFGTVQIEEEYRALLEMDAYHHIDEDKEYPPVLIFAGLKDGRVAAWDPAKFIAKLQNYSNSKGPILFDINFEEGHSNANFDSQYELYARVFSFALWQTGHPDYQLKE